VTRRGFTLLELLLALSLSGVAVLLGALLWRQTLSAGAALAVHRAALDRDQGARRWLQSTLGSLEIGAAGDAKFMGEPGRVSFSTWLPEPGGWTQRRDVTLGLEQHALVATTPDAPPLTLVDSVSAVGFDYLLEPGLTSRWAMAWESPISAPLAVRIRLTRLDGHADTLLLLVGPRG
jgi:prepilin-type N-terminal cleavage/methylation domain-containing protein